MASKTSQVDIHVANLHCQSCVDAIGNIIASVDEDKALSNVNISLQARSISFTHLVSFKPDALLRALAKFGFEVEPDFQSQPTAVKRPSFKWNVYLRKKFGKPSYDAHEREENHRKLCLSCSEKFPAPTQNMKEFKQDLYESRCSLEGMAGRYCDREYCSNYRVMTFIQCMH
ncbi:hypothetical protein M422DRAFT_55315 [Sphaerobolus stellatus SS14]|uniref:HMA domain-containing protein n=1 Tax=Sphaerobolus stellatus (strain SS14) TaxID=990650 RepID=A0A0C9UNU0_SPHS4|nr:hypothetical protein M422DRAFT_55315 [Sphaerobolus stellatus SS14]